MVLRIFASLILLCSVLFFPFWMTIILALVGIGYFAFFVEAILLFLLADLLYGVTSTGKFHSTFVAFLLAIVFFVLIESIKRKLR